MIGRCANERYCVIKSYAIWKSQKIYFIKILIFLSCYQFPFVSRAHKKPFICLIHSFSIPTYVHGIYQHVSKKSFSEADVISCFVSRDFLFHPKREKAMVPNEYRCKHLIVLRHEMINEINCFLTWKLFL